MTFEDADDVAEFRNVHENLQHAALDESTSREYLMKLARRFDQ